MSFALIQSAIGTIYSAPQAEASRTDEVLYGMLVEILKQDGEYHYIRTHYRYEGWIRREDLIPEDSACENWERSAQVLVAHSYADILSEPSIKAPPLISLTRGARLELTDSTPGKDGWGCVRLLDGRSGYIRENFLTPYIPPRPVSDLEENSFRKAVTESARSYLGTQYRWGGKTPLGIDCSGLCSAAYMLNGILIYRDASIQDGFPVHPIDRQDVKPGDLFYFPGHIAMSLGEDLFIHSTSKKGYFGVVINSFDPSHPHYRPDLLESLYACGSIF